MPIDNSRNILFGTPGLFSPTVIRTVEDPVDQSVSYNLSSIDSAISADSTSSFKYNPYGTGLRSTQQLNIDWSKFENHTFFNSAQVKLNVAFDKIQNQFPFDGTQRESEIYLDSLTGYEKYIFDNYPKNVGYLFFSGTIGGYEAGGGTYVTVVDQAGAAYTDASRLKDGKSILNFKTDPVSIEYWLYVPAQSNDNQVIIDRHSGSLGYLAGLNSSVSTTTATSTFYIVSGSASETLSVSFNKGQWNHFAWVWDRTPGYYGITAYLNGTFYATSSNPVEFETIDINTNLYIGSGSAIASVGYTPDNTLSGALDDLKIWSSVRSLNDIQQSYQKTIFAQQDLKAYYKFNEPSGSNSLIVIDASSNSLHGRLSLAGQTLGVRNISTGSLFGSSPVTYESVDLAPIIFGNHPSVLTYRSNYTLSASTYDDQNPNLITKLIPRHYFYEGQIEAALQTEQGPIVDQYQSGDDPRTTKLGATQTFLLLLYTWAKFFDEMKTYMQAFSDILFVDYDNIDTTPDQFLQQIANSQGFELPSLFNGATLGQFINANNIQDVISKNQYSLQYVQNQIWRRILINLRDVMTSKGTVHAIKSYIRSVGIDPDNNFRIREYGGPTKQNLGFVRETKNDIASILNYNSGGLVISPYLSGGRDEPGYPDIAGTPSDGLLTSGSWTYEAIYKFPKNRAYENNQSLTRFFVTGSSTGISGGITLNAVAVSGTVNQNPYVALYTRPNMGAAAPYLTLILSGVNIFDGEKWYVSFGRRRNDDGLDSVISSSYFLRVAKNNFGEIIENYTTASYFNDYEGSSDPVWNSLASTTNASGSAFIIGSASIDISITTYLNNTSFAPDVARKTNFQGDISHIRFWSKFVSVEEYREHVRNFKSLGVQQPLTNFNFVSYKSGSWEKIRIDANTDQIITQSNGSGQINIFDFSQNNFHLSGTLFPIDSQVIFPERYYYSLISPHFDDASTINKVRVRSYEQYENVVETPWAQVAPVYEIRKSEQPTDSTKFTIDYSVVEALNQDIINIFSTLDELDNALGAPELVFSPDYPDLESLRNVYFNRLTDKINLKQFFEFYKWFDTNIGTFVSQLIPKKTKYFGTNFVIESHMLERPKFEYLFSELYLGDSNRTGLRDRILLQLLVGTFARY